MEGLSVILIKSSVNALMLAMFYILVALGLTLVFSILDIVNFAHAEFYMIGGYISYVLFSQLHVNYFLTIVIAFLAVGAFLAPHLRQIFMKSLFFCAMLLLTGSEIGN